MAPPASALAQQSPPRITVRVRQVAGTSIYLDVGTRNGVDAGDTLAVLTGSGGTVEGHLAVVASTATRSLLTFAGHPFPLTRGANLVLQLLRRPAEAPPKVPTTPSRPVTSGKSGVQEAGQEAATTEAGAKPGPATPRTSPTPEQRKTETPRRPAHGRLSFGVSGMRSTTRVGSPDPLSVGRTFATPTMGLDLTVPQAVGPLSLHTSMFLTYRYSSGHIVQPAAAARVYAASLEGDFRRLRLILGRFHSPYEPYSGFWDGALLRVGGSGFGVGATAGFEPSLWDQSPSTSKPKASVFVDGHGHGEGWRWSGEISADAVRPTNGELDHTFIGTSQRLTAGPFRLSHDLEVDRDPTNGRWRVSRLYVRASLALTNRVQVHAGIGRSQPWLPGVVRGSPFALRYDRTDVGLSLEALGGYASTDLFEGKGAAGSHTWGATGTFSIPRLPGLSRIGVSGSLSRWSGTYGTTLSAAPSLLVDLRPVRLRVGYRLDRAKYLGRSIVTNGVDASVDAPLAGGFRLSGRLGAQFGGYLTTQTLELGLYRMF